MNKISNLIELLIKAESIKSDRARTIAVEALTREIWANTKVLRCELSKTFEEKS